MTYARLSPKETPRRCWSAPSTSPRPGDVPANLDESRSASSFEGTVYLSGVPGPRTRDWLLNLEADPHFVFHLKHGVTSDLPASASVINDPDERRRIFGRFVDDFNRRNGSGSPRPSASLDEWVERSPLAKVAFSEAS